MTLRSIRYILVAFLVCMLSAVVAHEFWLQPLKFIYSVGEKVKINFVAGVNFIGEPLNLKRDQLETLTHYHLSSTADLKATVVEGAKDHLEFTLPEEGTHLLAMQSIKTFYEQDADKFNAELKENGLDDVLAAREKAGATGKPGRELYSQLTKVLLQAGAKRDDTYKKVIGFPIEIVPERNPYALKAGENMRFKILWNKKPLFGVRVKVWNRKEGLTTLQNIYTEQDGTMETRISNKGTWMVSVVYMAPSKDTQAEWMSYRCNLVFGVE
ncbi:MAG TPA: DUF4198 domain-containing protein, partial [Ohtaekwangia sp.]|uniref:DUF4198 domain-containing protein n=1 Tax=Ohtaekwangia sp. TaxID=2066019 RepID=UPI002F95DFAC